MAAIAMVLKFFAMIGNIENQRILIETFLLQELHQHSEIVIVERDFLIVSIHHIFQNIRGSSWINIGDSSHPLKRTRPEIAKRLGWVIRSMRIHWMDIQEKWFFAESWNLF